MVPALPGSAPLALAFAMGAGAYIGALHLWFLRRNRGEPTHGWVALWAMLSLAFQAGRLLQLTTSDPAEAVFGGRLQVALTLPLLYTMIGFARSLNRWPNTTRSMKAGAAAAALVALVGIATPLFLSGQTDIRVDWWGNHFIGAPGTPFTGLLMVAILGASIYTWRVSAASGIHPDERRALLAGTGAYIGCTLLSVLSAVRLISMPLLSEYAPLLFSVGLSYLLVHRHRRLATELEQIVEERTSELRDSERRYRRLVENAPIGVVACDRDGQITAVNSHLVDLLGSPSSAATERFNMLESPLLVDSGISEAFQRCLDRGVPVTREFEYTSAWGRDLVVRAHIAPLRDDDDEVRGAQAVVEDVSERTRLERSLRQSRKMEAVGELAAGIAHEINNPMAYVRSNLQMVRDEFSTLDAALKDQGDVAESARARLAEIEELVDDSLDGVQRTVNLVREVKEFSHGRGLEPEDVHLNDVMEEAIRYASPQKPAGVKLEHHYGELPVVSASPNQLRQMFLNLIVNAYHAVGDVGCVRIVTRTTSDAVIVRVEDDGCGIVRAVRDRIFEPFFTTKTAGEGTGLGLYFSYQIAQLHGGELRVESQPGMGAAFEFRLPTPASRTER